MAPRRNILSVKKYVKICFVVICSCPLNRREQRRIVLLLIFGHSCCQAVDKAGLKLPNTVEAIMNRWILQMGFPVITVNTKTGLITQQHFLLDPDSAVVTPSLYK